MSTKRISLALFYFTCISSSSFCYFPASTRRDLPMEAYSIYTVHTRAVSIWRRVRKPPRGRTVVKLFKNCQGFLPLEGPRHSIGRIFHFAGVFFDKLRALKRIAPQGSPISRNGTGTHTLYISQYSIIVPRKYIFFSIMSVLTL